MKVFRSLGSLQSPGSLGSPVHLFVLVGVAVCINSHVLCHKILFLIFAVLLLDWGYVIFVWRCRICSALSVNLLVVMPNFIRCFWSLAVACGREMSPLGIILFLFA